MNFSQQLVANVIRYMASLCLFCTLLCATNKTQAQVIVICDDYPIFNPQSSAQTGTSISVSPNPFTEYLRIQSTTQNMLNIQITDSQGNNVISEDVFAGCVSICTANMNVGTYNLTVTTNNKVFTEKIIKE